MANRSSFVAPNYVVDSFIEHHNISESDKPNILRYQTLLTQPSRTVSEDIEFNNLTTGLQDKIMSPEYINLLQDAMINIEANHQIIYNNYVATFNALLNKYSDKGIWDNTLPYQQWNTVSYGGQTFRSKQDGNTNHTPVGGVSDLWWVLEAKQGSQGIPGLSLVYVGAYNNATPYTIGQAVSYTNGLIYYCIQNSIGNLPTTITYWSLFPIGTVPIIQSTQPSSAASGQVWIQTY